MAGVTTTGSVLGEGPVATVYSGLYENAPVALKVYPGRFDKTTLAAVERERSTLAALHAALLPVVGIELFPGNRHALRMPLCNTSLAAKVRTSGPLSADDVAALGRDVAQALAAAHKADVVHGGVTPHNVLFRGSTPVLADPGVALRQAFPRDPLHAIEFQPPETARTGVLDEQTDIYGLGAVLHFALTGSSPHPARLGEPQGERILRVLREPIPAVNRADVPTALSTVVARMLAVDPNRRPLDAATVATQLATLAPPLPLPLPPTPPAPRKKRHWIPWTAGGVLLLAAGALFLLPHNKPPREPSPPQTQIDLLDPVDQGDHVQLTWHSKDKLQYAVAVTPEGGDTQVTLAQDATTVTLPVHPNRKYCFQVRAADGPHIYQSQPKPIRGATCK